MSKRLVGLAVLIIMMLTGCGEDENQAPVQAIGKEEFQSYIKEVEITSDNWEQYFSIEEYSVSEKDAFGEETGVSYDFWYLNPNKNVCPSNDLVMEFSYISVLTNEQFWDKETFEEINGCTTSDVKEECLVILRHENFFVYGERERAQCLCNTREKLSGGLAYDSNGRMVTAWWERTYDISDLRLNRSAGTISVFSIPEDKWLVDDEHGRYIILSVGESHVEYLFENGAYAFDSIDNINWEDDFYGCSSWSLDWLR